MAIQNWKMDADSSTALHQKEIVLFRMLGHVIKMVPFWNLLHVQLITMIPLLDTPDRKNGIVVRTVVK